MAAADGGRQHTGPAGAPTAGALDCVWTCTRCKRAAVAFFRAHAAAEQSQILRSSEQCLSIGHLGVQWLLSALEVIALAKHRGIRTINVVRRSAQRHELLALGCRFPPSAFAEPKQYCDRHPLAEPHLRRHSICVVHRSLR